MMLIHNVPIKSGVDEVDSLAGMMKIRFFEHMIYFENSILSMTPNPFQLAISVHAYNRG